MSWLEDYNKIVTDLPTEGAILKTETDEKVKLTVVLNEGSSPFIYGKAYVPDIVGSELGWFLRGINSTSNFGWKCILMPRARTDLIKKYKINENIEVTSLRVVRVSQTGKSLLCEVDEY